MYTKRELKDLCLQISMYLESGISLDEGFRAMSEDSTKDWEKTLLKDIADELEVGEPLHVVMEMENKKGKDEYFPKYMIKMAKLGQKTGNLSNIMKSLSDYYEKEYVLGVNIKNALTYPIIMVFMLLVVLSFLFIKVIPIFKGVYESLGAELSPMVEQGIEVGGFLSVTMLFLGIVGLGFGVYVYFKGNDSELVNKLKSKSKIALGIGNQRLASVLHMTLKSGMEFEKGLELAEELVNNKDIESKIVKAKDNIENGKGYYESLKEAELFNSSYGQLIKTGAKSGHLDQVMSNIADNYSQEIEDSLDNMISKLEPTVIVILAFGVGMVLLSVMLPLASVLASLG